MRGMLFKNRLKKENSIVNVISVNVFCHCVKRKPMDFKKEGSHTCLHL